MFIDLKSQTPEVKARLEQALSDAGLPTEFDFPTLDKDVKSKIVAVLKKELKIEEPAEEVYEGPPEDVPRRRYSKDTSSLKYRPKPEPDNVVNQVEQT